MVAVDRLKVDRSLVADLEKNQSAGVVLSSIIDMARRMQIDLIAEGVETATQQDQLLDKNCHCMQGYFFGRPMPAEEFTALLDRP